MSATGLALGLIMKNFLVGLTAVAVVSDTMLIPFYPRFFDVAFGIGDPRHVGYYLAAVCLTVMLGFPAWAHVARRIDTLRLLVYTQLAAGVLSVVCAWAPSLAVFWLVSLAMVAFKASYLLIYPLIMSREPPRRHAATIGLLTVVVHLGSISGAVLGGVVLEIFDPRQVFLVMAVGDLLQAGVCLYLIRRGETAPPGEAPPAAVGSRGRVYALSLVMLLFYFSVFLIRPFFVRFWQSISGLESDATAALVFSLPAAVAVLTLWIGRRRSEDGSHYLRIMAAMLLGTIGLLLQATGLPAAVLIGRGLFGWAVFEGMVRLDQQLFQLSTTDSYARDFSKASFFQNLGVLIASYAAGAVVAAVDLVAPFWLAAGGFAICGLTYGLLFRTTREPTASRAPV